MGKGWKRYLTGERKSSNGSARRRRKEINRELFFETFPTIGVEPHLADRLGSH
jgi:hypothetical protein